MKFFSILPLAIVLASTCAIGQDAVVHPGPNPLSLTGSPSPNSANCPVGLQVNHAVSLRERQTEYSPFAPPAPSVQEQRIQLTLSNPSLREIVRAQFTIRGLSDKWRAVPLADPRVVPDLARTVTVVLHVKRDGHASSDLSLSRFASITAVELNSLTYADGSTWRSSSPAACSVTPDPFMLVSAAR
jgi:hypothetical protein